MRTQYYFNRRARFSIILIGEWASLQLGSCRFLWGEGAIAIQQCTSRRSEFPHFDDEDGAELLSYATAGRIRYARRRRC